jgi:hypothetical protein
MIAACTEVSCCAIKYAVNLMCKCVIIIIIIIIIISSSPFCARNHITTI